MNAGLETSSPDDRLVLAGDLTIYTAAENHGRLLAHLEARANCDLDLSGVSEMDGAGLQLLLWAARAAEARDARFRLVARSQAVSEVLELLHLDSRFGFDSAVSAEGGTA